MIAGIILVFLIIAAVIFPKSKEISICILLFMWFMYSFVYYEGDLQIYEWIYGEVSLGSHLSSFEPGYTLLMVICSKLRLSFAGFRVVLASIYTMLLYCAVRKFTDYPAVVLAALTVFPFFVFTSVIRSGIASVIVLYAIRFLLVDDLEAKYKYIVGILIATTIHYSSIVLLVLLFAKKRINVKKLLGWFVLALTASLVFIYSDWFYNTISSITSNEKILQWFSKGEGTMNTKGILALAIVLAGNYFFSKLALDKSTRATENHLNKIQYRTIELAYNASIIMAFFAPFMIISPSFIRYAYMLCGLSFSAFINAYYGMSEKLERIGEIPNAIVGLIAVVVMWSLYFDYPYLQQGESIFTSLINIVLMI